MSIYLLFAGFVVFGLIGLALGWKLLLEYQREFLADPQKTMSVEVFTRLMGLGGYGYFAVLAIVIGIASVVVGLAFLIGLLVAQLN